MCIVEPREPVACPLALPAWTHKWWSGVGSAHAIRARWMPNRCRCSVQAVLVVGHESGRDGRHSPEGQGALPEQDGGHGGQATGWRPSHSKTCHPRLLVCVRLPVAQPGGVRSSTVGNTGETEQPSCDSQLAGPLLHVSLPDAVWTTRDCPTRELGRISQDPDSAECRRVPNLLHERSRGVFHQSSARINIMIVIPGCGPAAQPADSTSLATSLRITRR